jgi:putative hydrolase of the HAD superfamily
MPHSDLLIAFDLGNVLSLVDESAGARELAKLSGKTEAAAFEAVFAPQRKAAIETGRQSFGDFVDECCGRLGIRLPVSQFRQLYESVLTPNTDIFPLVARLMAEYRVALCSNTSSVHWELERRRLPFGMRFDPAVVSYEVGVMKPQPGIFNALARAAKVRPGNILFIDDRPENVAGARRVGLSALEFRSVMKLEEDLKRMAVL